MNCINFSETFIDNFILNYDQDKLCCVCFSNNVSISKKSLNLINQTIIENDLSLSDLEPYFFNDDVIPDDLLIKSCCNIHYICIKCLRLILNNYENHPINENNSHLSCPFPFKECVTSIGFKNVFDHNLIKKIMKSDKEWNNYMTHAERYAFPGYTIIKCPMYTRYHQLCDTEIIIENDFLKNKPIGEVIINCDQNENCLRKFCFHCKQIVKYYDTECFDCKTIHENENPNIFNYYLNKNSEYSNQKINYDSYALSDSDSELNSELNSTLNYSESSYLFLNKEITEDIVINQIILLLSDVNSYMICAICKNSLYKTERCNGLSHHNLERCYACGRIGFISKGLVEHWNSRGIEGCVRFDHESFVKKYIPDFCCTENECSNHEKGDCTDPEHEKGILQMKFCRKYAYVYHILKSLLPNIRINVYDSLFYKLSNEYPQYLIYLPYKQSLILLQEYKKRYKDYTEDILYENLECIHPKDIPEYIVDKSYYITPNEYINKYTFKETCNEDNEYNRHTNYNEMSYWRTTFTSEIREPLLLENQTLVQEIDEFDTIGTIDITDLIDTQLNSNLELPSITLNSYSLLIDIESDSDTISDILN